MRNGADRGENKNQLNTSLSPYAGHFGEVILITHLIIKSLN